MPKQISASTDSISRKIWKWRSKHGMPDKIRSCDQCEAGVCLFACTYTPNIKYLYFNEKFNWVILVGGFLKRGGRLLVEGVCGPCGVFWKYFNFFTEISFS